MELVGDVRVSVGHDSRFEGQELPTLFTARIMIELVPPGKPVMVKGLVVCTGDKAVQLMPLSVEYS